MMLICKMQNNRESTKSSFKFLTAEYKNTCYKGQQTRNPRKRFGERNC